MMYHSSENVNKNKKLPEKIFINAAALDKPVLDKKGLLNAISCNCRPVDRKLLQHYVCRSTAARYAPKESAYVESHGAPLSAEYLRLFRHKNPFVIWLILRIALAGNVGISLGRLKKLTGKSKYQIKRALKRQKVCFVYMDGYLLTANIKFKARGLFFKDYQTGEIVPAHGTKASVAACAKARAAKEGRKLLQKAYEQILNGNSGTTYFQDMEWDLRQRVLESNRARYQIPESYPF